MALIELQDVSKLYGFGDATTIALDEINLSIEKGEFVTVMGPSGSGKSTLLNVIGLLDRPSSGNYALDGREVIKLSPNARARTRRDTIGFIFQSFNLLQDLTVLENVALPLAYKNIRKSQRIKRSALLLTDVGLQEKQFFYPRHLSGGQSQRVAIARSLVNNPSLIIADEPTGNLDSANSRMVMDLLAELNRNGNTIIMVTHNPELTRYATRALYMADGSIVRDERKTQGLVAEHAVEFSELSTLNHAVAKPKKEKSHPAAVRLAESAELQKKEATKKTTQGIRKKPTRRKGKKTTTPKNTKKRTVKLKNREVSS
jgi:putative ABC transport system ATP-binding protein